MRRCGSYTTLEGGRGGGRGGNLPSLDNFPLAPLLNASTNRHSILREVLTKYPTCGGILGKGAYTRIISYRYLLLHPFLAGCRTRVSTSTGHWGCQNLEPPSIYSILPEAWFSPAEKKKEVFTIRQSVVFVSHIDKICWVRAHGIHATITRYSIIPAFHNLHPLPRDHNEASETERIPGLWLSLSLFFFCENLKENCGESLESDTECLASPAHPEPPLPFCAWPFLLPPWAERLNLQCFSLDYPFVCVCHFFASQRCSGIRNSLSVAIVHCARSGQEAPENRDSQICCKKISEYLSAHANPQPLLRTLLARHKYHRCFQLEHWLRHSKNSPAILPLAKIIPRLG